ncbi:serine acetyltransferase [Mailhella massiliensis]|uniref:Serine acetyltransferase n=1 Tax=Mailhella massiliensis TaxID=1903261 RepID=A0A921AX02_9BACT|nr:serine acetyltransferase [Mailhella massiliensis]HJD97872.1 serine acetyltransferase [Mailhella massiliensis]
MPDRYLPPILPCSTCGSHEQKLESCLPAGRRHALWRVVCPCGCALTQWAVSEGAAIRLWNRFLGENPEQ